MTRIRIEVGVLGATGTVGQQFIALLENHPWFRVAWLAASERSAGRRYGELPWRLPVGLSPEVAALPVHSLQAGSGPHVVFSALDASVAGEIEEAFAAAGHIVVSNARNHRMSPLVPLIVPEINPEHLALLRFQQPKLGWRGALVTNPNCSAVFLTLALAALCPFEPERVLVTTMQAVSGAGHPGVASLDALGNVIPVVQGEEEKLEAEPRKILGRVVGDSVQPHPVAISAQTNRVPVVNGHLETVAVGFRHAPTEADILAAFKEFVGKPQSLALPSAPPRPLVYLDQADRPQPRLDVERHGGMAVCVGRLRRCPVLDFKFVLLGHNTIRGAAGAALLNAELMVAEGWIPHPVN